MLPLSEPEPDTRENETGRFDEAVALSVTPVPATTTGSRRGGEVMVCGRRVTNTTAGIAVTVPEAFDATRVYRALSKVAGATIAAVNDRLELVAPVIAGRSWTTGTISARCHRCWR